MKKERLTQEELTDIDLDVVSAMNRIPKNKNYNSLYMRYDVENNGLMTKLCCDKEHLADLIFGLLNNSEEEGIEFYEDIRNAILQVALVITTEMDKKSRKKFIELIKEMK